MVTCVFIGLMIYPSVIGMWEEDQLYLASSVLEGQQKEIFDGLPPAPRQQLNAAPVEVATSLAPAIVPAVAGTHGSSDPRWLASIPTLVFFVSEPAKWTLL